MSHVGYARVSSTGQSLDVQMGKLKQAGCSRIYHEKKSGLTTKRPEFKECMNYLREGDTLVITRLDRLARSVIHLAEIAKRFQNESINLVVLDQKIDTCTSTGRLMFNMLASIAEFENDLRLERQAEGIVKAKERGVKFGRPAKLTNALREDIYLRRMSGATVGQLAKEFNFGEATIYRVLKAVRESGSFPQLKTTKITLWLQIENNSKFVRGKAKTRRHIEDYCLPEYNAKKINKDGWEYELTFHYKDDKDLERQINDLSADMSQTAELRNGFVERCFTEVETGRSW